MHVITIDRFYSNENETLSRFKCDTLRISGVGVEDEYRAVKVMHETRIPKGFYEIDFVFSQRFSNEYYINKRDYTLISRKQYQTLSKQQRDNYEAHKLLHFRNVKGFENVLLHWGNTEKDTSGCYIVGTSIVMFGSHKGVNNSRRKYEEIYPIIYKEYSKGEDIRVEVQDNDLK